MTSPSTLTRVMTTATSAEIAATLIRSYVQSTAQLRQQVRDLVLMWFGAHGFRGAGAVAFVRVTLPILLAAQRTMATLTDAYLAQQISTLSGQSIPPRGVPDDLIASPRLRQGVSLETVLRRPHEQVWSALSRGKSFEEAVKIGRTRAESIAMTNLQLAKTRASREVMKDDRRVVGYRRVLTGVQSCGLCVIASTLRYRRSDLMPIHPGCVPFGSYVRALNVLGATRRWYSGKLIILTPRSGDQVTVTPKHPVLTEQGWVAADLVREGDYLFCDKNRIKWPVNRDPYKDKTPALVEDVWRSLTMTFDFTRVPLATEDFHGDGSDDEVDVVHADGYFSSVGNTHRSKYIDQGLFVSRRCSWSEFNGLGTATTFIPASYTSAGSSIRSKSLSSAFFTRHLCRAHETGFRGASSLDTCLSEPPFDGMATDTLLMSDRLLSEAPVDVVGVELLDRIVDITHVDFSHYVFNFQTSSGMYSHNHHIIHNCDCAIAPIVGSEDPGTWVNSSTVTGTATAVGENEKGAKIYQAGAITNLGDLLEPVHRAVEERFGSRATGGREIDYRKVLLTRQHGELGPVLTVASHRFTRLQATQVEAKRDQ